MHRTPSTIKYSKEVSIIDRLRCLLHIVQAPKYAQCFKVILSFIYNFI